MLLIQILGIVFLSVASAIASTAINVVLVAVVLSCLVVVSGVREVYLRQEPPLLSVENLVKAEEGLCHGERPRSQLLLKLAGAEIMPILAVNVLAVNGALHALCGVKKCLIHSE